MRRRCDGGGGGGVGGGGGGGDGGAGVPQPDYSTLLDAAEDATLRAAAACALHVVTVVAAVRPGVVIMAPHIVRSVKLCVALCVVRAVLASAWLSQSLSLRGRRAARVGVADALPTPDWDAAVARAVDSDALALDDAVAAALAAAEDAATAI